MTATPPSTTATPRATTGRKATTTPIGSAAKGAVLGELTKSLDGVPEELHQTTWCAERSIAFIEANRDRPWLLSVNPYDPHPPFNPPKRYRDMFDPEAMPGPHFRSERPGAAGAPRGCRFPVEGQGPTRAGHPPPDPAEADGLARRQGCRLRPRCAGRLVAAGRLLRHDQAHRRPARPHTGTPWKAPASARTPSSSSPATTARCWAITA